MKKLDKTIDVVILKDIKEEEFQNFLKNFLTDFWNKNQNPSFKNSLIT